MSIAINLEKRAEILCVHISGELDHHTSKQLRKEIDDELERGSYKHLVLDLEHLTFMDSSGLGVILGRYKVVTGYGGKLVVCSTLPQIKRILEMAGLFKIISLAENRQAALNMLGVA